MVAQSIAYLHMQRLEISRIFFLEETWIPGRSVCRTWYTEIDTKIQR